MTLHVYYNGSDYNIAASAEDATAIHCERTGETTEDVDFVWKQVEDAKMIKIEFEPGRQEGGLSRTRTAAEWIAEYERGYLCGEDY